ncbi:MAG: DUF192 domain-containing protein [Candidatus Eremiobacteraeota bacterium]|nr:DUF192 domain-containing protein [Candidatus Eremiobacteraeota bacterium]
MKNNRKYISNYLRSVVISVLIIIIFTSLSCGSTSGSGGDSPASTPTVVPTGTPQPQLPVREIKVGEVTISAEIADDHEERQAGLSWRQSLGENDGMLFVFEEKRITGMWMYGMLFPIDVIWICDDTIVEIDENVPNPADPNSTSAPTYQPDQEINFFLEVNAGFVEKHGIKIGDKLLYSE